MGICVSCRRRERKAPEKRTVLGAGGPVKGAAAAELLPRRIDRLPMMANSMTNIKIKNPIKIIVSKHRRRYMKDGFNLDLAYITDRLIAMGFPAEKLEGVYRNHIDEVYRFLEKMHKDHYKIYNLCTERSYDSSKFHERVERYAFDDHTPPSIEMIQPFCEDVDKWLNSDPKNVAAVHCKAGKGRTGTMICCYLLYSEQKPTADEALKFYGTERTYDDKGVTIPSQRRYVEYYAWLLKSGLQYVPTKVHIRELVITPPPFQYAGNTVPELQITQWNPFIKAPIGCHEVRRSETSLHVYLTHCTPLYGDVRVGLNNKHKMKMRKEKLFHFWFNTFFVAVGVGAVSHPPLSDSPNLETFKLTLNKWQLDDAHKDDKHKNFSQDFKVELIIQKLPDSSTFSGGGVSRAPSPASPPSSSSSSCSEPDTEPEAHWDSGERFLYSPLEDDTLSYERICATATPITDYAESAVGDFKNAVGDYTSAVPDYASAVGDYNASNTPAGDCKASAVGEQGVAIKPVGDFAVGNRGLHDYCNTCTKNGDDKVCDYTADNMDQLSSGASKKFSDANHAADLGYASSELNSHKKIPDSGNDYVSDAVNARRLRERDTPTINPLYCSKADAFNSTNKKISGCKSSSDPPHAASFDHNEPMEYSNEVFSSAPTSARESPVEECKAKRTDDKTKPRLSLGDMRASWREFSRRRKDES